MVTHANNATLGAAITTIIGSLGPWVAVGRLNVSGWTGDGKITLTLAACAGLLALAPAFAQRDALRTTATLAGVFTAIIGWRAIIITANEPLISTGWGIWLVALGGTALAATPWIGHRTQETNNENHLMVRDTTQLPPSNP